MLFDFMFQFIGQVLILMSLGIVYGLFTYDSVFHPIIRKLSMGIITVFVIIYVMQFNIPLDTTEQFFFDVRSLVLGLSGMFLGLIPTLMGTIAALIYRIAAGGDGIFLGVLEILIGAAIGLTWRYQRLKKVDNKTISWMELYFIGFTMQLIILSLALTLPRDIMISIFRVMSFPQLVLFPIGFLLTAQFMLLQRKRYFKNVEVLESEIQFKNLFEENKAILMLIDPNTGMIVDVNKRSIEVYGYTKEEFLQLNINQLNILDNEKVKELIEEARSKNKSTFLFKHRTKFGKIIDIEVNTGPIKLNNSTYLYTTAFDVSEQMITERLFKNADERLRKTLLSVGEGVIVTDDEHRIIIVNDKAKELLGKSNMIIRNFVYDEFRIYSNKETIDFKQIYLNAIEENETFRSDFSYSLIDNNNNVIYIDFTLSPIINDLGENHGAILVIRDVTIEKERQEEARFLSKHDYLTKLYNRYNFEEELKRLNVARQHPISLIIGDVNGLKLVNDAFGHLEGDRLLQEAANIFKKAVRSEDIVCRWGGDEFAILLPQTSKEGAEKVIARIKDLCEKSFFRNINPSISVGLAVKEYVNQPVNEILKKAEELMYNEKSLNGPKYREKFVDAMLENLSSTYDGHKQHTENLTKLIHRYSTTYDVSQSYKNDLLLLAKYHDIGRVTAASEQNESAYDSTNSKAHLKHPEVGSRIVSVITHLQQLAIPILHHHEHYDGTGFPSNIKGEKINELARLFSVIHYYEKLLHNYPNESHKELMVRMRDQKGKILDPLFVENVIFVIEEDL